MGSSQLTWQEMERLEAEGLSPEAARCPSLDIRTKVNQLEHMSEMPLQAKRLKLEIFQLLDIIEDRKPNQTKEENEQC